MIVQEFGRPHIRPWWQSANRNVGTTRDIIGMGQHLEETCWSVSIISSLYQDLGPKSNRNASNMFHPNPINTIENNKTTQHFHKMEPSSWLPIFQIQTNFVLGRKLFVYPERFGHGAKIPPINNHDKSGVEFCKWWWFQIHQPYIT